MSTYDQPASGRILCPKHQIPDCSPLLNGCSRVVELQRRIAADQTAAEPGRARCECDGLMCTHGFRDADANVVTGFCDACRDWCKDLKTPAPDSERGRLAAIIWEASRADEGTISATGANIVADAILAADSEQAAVIRAVTAVVDELGDTDTELIDVTALYERLRTALAGHPTVTS